MRVKQLILTKYKPLLLNGIEYFEYNPESDYQTIVGTNGSGKSSIMRELTPYPPTTADYRRGGSKVITLDNAGKTYILSTTIGRSNHHSFTVDGNELNDGHTGAVQKVLVEQHFGLDSQLRDVLIDKVVFTAMGPQQRSDWITRLSGGNLDYAVLFYNRLKQRTRDLQGTIKYLQKRIMSESEKLTDEKGIKLLTDNASVIKKELRWLMTARTNDNPITTEMLQERLSGLLRELNNSTRQGMAINVDVPQELIQGRISGVDDLVNHINALRYREKITMESLKSTQAEYGELSEIIEAVEAVDGKGIDDLNKSIEQLLSDNSRRMSGMRILKEIDEPTHALENTKNVSSRLSELLTTHTDNSTGKFTRGAITQARDKADSLVKETDKFERFIARASDRIQTIDEAKNSKCPKCGYIWIEGVSDNERSNLSERLEKAAVYVDGIKEQHKEVAEYLEEAEVFMGNVRNLRSMVDAYPRLQPLWDVILEEGMLSKPPGYHVPLIHAWNGDLLNAVEVDKNNKTIKNYQDAIEQIKIHNPADNHYLQRIGKLETTLSSLTDEISVIRRDIQRLEIFKKGFDQLNRHYVESNQTIDKINSVLKTGASELRNHYIDECISKHQSALALIEHDLSAIENAKRIVEDLKKEHGALCTEFDDTNILIRELSPTHGYIADQMMGFITHVLDDLNSIIGDIWTHELRVLPCRIDAESLDYKFPLVLKSHEDPVPDISDGSSAQVDVINFAFKLIVMLYLNIQDYPLYLDEPAPRMDEQHRENLMKFVRTLVESNRCSQLFMISHYYQLHGAFANAQYCVTDTANITVPSRYNEHVVMK